MDIYGYKSNKCKQRVVGDMLAKAGNIDEINNTEVRFTTDEARLPVNKYGYLFTKYMNENYMLQEFIPTDASSIWIRKKTQAGLFDWQEVYPGIETITNENGTAIKYPDGTMICKSVQDLGTLNYKQHENGTYWTGVYHTWTFPVEFASNDIVVNINVFNTALSFANLQDNPTTTKAKTLITTFSDGSRATKLHWIAIGRWK